MIGYKATDMNGCCRGIKFEVGKTYTKDTPKDELECCTDKVFHFCRELFAIEKESGYILSESRIFEVIAGDYVRSGDKYGTNSLTILREIEGEEKSELINTGNCNSGSRNSGDCNTGDCNTVDFNSGSRNSDNWNTGSWNTGNCNSGSRNTSNCNTGSWNTGNYNSGSRNSGSRNSGNCNTGNCNTGDFNSGFFNTGDYNSGSWNTGDFNSGFFNTDESPVRMFNKCTKLKRREIHIPAFCYIRLTIWVSHDTASDEEKEEHKREIETCGGFLKTLGYKEAWRIAWDRASKEEHLELLKLPNWDNEVFKEISGIDAEAEIAEE